MMGYWWGGTPWWAWLLGSLVMLVILALVVASIWYLLTRFAVGSDRLREPDAKSVLDARLAKGDIGPEQYRRVLDLIADRGERSPEEPTPAGASERR